MMEPGRPRWEAVWVTGKLESMGSRQYSIIELARDVEIPVRNLPNINQECMHLPQGVASNETER
jgi:hypothetical protein